MDIGGGQTGVGIVRYPSSCAAYENEVNELLLDVQDAHSIHPQLVTLTRWLFPLLPNFTQHTLYKTSLLKMVREAEYEDDFVLPPRNFGLRNISINTQPGPAIDFLFVTGIQLPGATQVCTSFADDFNLHYLDVLQYLKDLCDTTKHPREAYGHLHPAAYGERFFKRLSNSKFVQSETFTFFLLPILKYKIDQEVAKHRKAFLISGLEHLLRASREFTLKIAQPVAVICFRDSGASALKARSMIEQLFSQDDLIDVPVGASVEATYRRLLAETVVKHGMPSSPSYSPSP